MCQNKNKWDYGSNKMTEKNVSDEDEKNFNSVKHSELHGIKIITIIFTTQPYEGSENLPEILIVSKDNFKSYFGPGIGDDSINTVIAKRPYISEDHFHNVNPKADKRHKLDFFPFDIQGTEIYTPDHLIEN
ncbi:unnamed protein product [Rhizophagus irregularis]|nr:unnamed protein product [Rhizophagus irregularis]